MKKICVLTLGIIAAASMSAQTATVKEAEKAFKGVNSYSSYQNADYLLFIFKIYI